VTPGVGSLIALYLGAIVGANLAVATWGPGASIVIAFAFVGLDLTTRDRLHELYAGRARVAFLAILIASGGLLSWILNREAGIIAIASTGAFLAAAIVDSIVYQLLEDRPRSVRVNGSNVAAAIVDSVLFVGIAFGSFLSPIVLAQVLAKITGGALWSLVLPQPAPVPLEAGT
jgi:uncharacterized PurR-regulated membrane protein YhhQ (DUF165 family)